MQISQILITIGIILVVVGVLWHYTPLGKLPGDFTFGKNVKIYFPLASSIIISIILTLIFFIIAHLKK